MCVFFMVVFSPKSTSLRYAELFVPIVLAPGAEGFNPNVILLREL